MFDESVHYVIFFSLSKAQIFSSAARSHISSINDLPLEWETKLHVDTWGFFSRSKTFRAWNWLCSSI